MTTKPPELPISALQNLARQTLAEDVGSGDATTLAVVPADMTLEAVFRNREDCVVAGFPIARAIFQELDKRCELEILAPEGTFCKAGTELAVIHGPAQAVLTGERGALNFLQRLC